MQFFDLEGRVVLSKQEFDQIKGGRLRDVSLQHGFKMCKLMTENVVDLFAIRIPTCRIDRAKVPTLSQAAAGCLRGRDIHEPGFAASRSGTATLQRIGHVQQCLARLGSPGTSGHDTVRPPCPALPQQTHVEFPDRPGHLPVVEPVDATAAAFGAQPVAQAPGRRPAGVSPRPSRRCSWAEAGSRSRRTRPPPAHRRRRS